MSPFLIALVVVTTTGCSTFNPVGSLDQYCAMMEKKLPILLSRKDSTETKRQVAALNESYEANCKGPTQ